MVDVSASSGGEIAGIATAFRQASSYRVKLRRREFPELVEIAKPNIIYHRKRMFFFAFDGFVMYTLKCERSDFQQLVLETIVFSNQSWNE
jgi:hypothetical protein